MLRISDVAVTVSSAKRSAAWWSEKLGFRVHIVGAPGGHAVMVAPPGERFLLHLCEGYEPVNPGNTGIGFVTDDIHPIVQRMEAAGVRLIERPGTGPGPKGAKFADPDGNVYWLIEVPTEFLRRETERRGAQGDPSRPVRRKASARHAKPKKAR